MKKRVLIALAVTLAVLMVGVFTAWAYVDYVVSVVGAYGAPTGAYTGTTVAESLVTDAPDQGFIQLADYTEITLYLDPCVSVDTSTSTSDLIIDTYDRPYPAAAKVEVSNDGTDWYEVSGPALNDCEEARQHIYDDVCPGLSPSDPPSDICLAHIDLTSTGLESVCYVRMTDYDASVDGENVYPTLGFDLDAIYEGHQRFQDCQPVTTIEVDIDIKPGSYPNCFNVNGHGVIPVAILGTETFDVNDIDVGTLLFGGLGVRVKGKGTPQCSVEDVSGDFTYPEGAPDGWPDLVCQFVDDDGAWVAGDDTATLTGQLLDGTPIEGSDSICIVP